MFDAIFFVVILMHCIYLKIILTDLVKPVFGGAICTDKFQTLAQGYDLSAGIRGCASLVRRWFLVEEILRLFD